MRKHLQCEMKILYQHSWELWQILASPSYIHQSQFNPLANCLFYLVECMGQLIAYPTISIMKNYFFCCR